jgi:hypothetical protein
VGNDSRNRRVPTTQALAERHVIGRDALLLKGKHGARATCSAHDLVEDQENTVYLSQTARTAAKRGRDAAGRGADDGLCGQGHNGVRAQPQERVCELFASRMYAWGQFL